MSSTTFSGPVTSTAGFVLPSYTVASAPASAPAGKIIYVSNGRAGLPTVAVGNGTNWIGSAGIAIAVS